MADAPAMEREDPEKPKEGDPAEGRKKYQSRKIKDG